MSDELKGRTALVTGASRGMGRVIALELGRLGAEVAVTARTVTPHDGPSGTVHDTVRQLEELGTRAVGIGADLSKPGDVARVVEETIAALGPVDILVNNAAYLADSMYESFWTMTAEVWREQVEVNLQAPFALIKGFAAGMAERGGGLVVNMTSGASEPREGPQPLPGHGGTGAGYGTTKAALNRMTNALANELRSSNIAVVAVNPGSTLTENYPRVAEKYGFDVTKAHPMTVPAKVVAYLATCPDPLVYTGTVLTARPFALEHELVEL